MCCRPLRPAATGLCPHTNPSPSQPAAGLKQEPPELTNSCLDAQSWPLQEARVPWVSRTKGCTTQRGYLLPLSLCIRSQALTYLLEFCNVPRLDQSEKSICLLISFPLYHLRYNSNTQKEMALEISGIQSLHPFKSSRGQRPSGEMPNRGI